MKKSIGIDALHHLGYRVCHAKNIALAQNVLSDILGGKVVLKENIEAAIAALKHTPLSSAQTIILTDD